MLSCGNLSNKKKKILIVSAVFIPEQVTSALLNYDLARELSKKYDVTVLRPYPSRPLGMRFLYEGLGDEPFNTILIDSYIHPKANLMGRFRESVDFGIKASRYIKKNCRTFDLIYNSAWQLFGVALVSRTAQKYHIPYIMVVQDVYPESLLTRGVTSWFLRKAVLCLLKPIDIYCQRNAKKVRTITEEMAKYLSETRKIPKDNYLIVNNWQNDDDFKVVPSCPSRGIMRFVFVGTINLHANVDMIISAFAEANIPNTELAIYGGGDRRDYCESLVSQMGLNNVVFGFVKRDEIPQVQSNANILVLALPSGNSDFCLPSKLTSYMLSGKPILASVDSDSATARFVKEAQCGYIVEPDRIMDMAKGFQIMAEKTHADLHQMGNNARKFADVHLSKKKNLKIICDCIDEIIN